ncbi:MAG TPA: BatA domain-containing protein [Polyangia bacterium]
MHFVAPLYLAGLLAASIPIIVHLVGRSRARVRPFAAIDFIVRSNRRVARRLRLRELLLLALRALAAAGLAMVLAKPYVEAATDLPASIGRPQSVVLVLDNSASMGYRLGGDRLYDLARRRARQVLDLLGREADAALVLGAEGDVAAAGDAAGQRVGAPVNELTTDRLRLRRAVDEAPLSARATDIPGALRRAAQILGHSARAERRVIVLTDLTAAGFGDGDAPWPPGSGPEVTVIDVSRGAPLPNRAVTGIKVDPAPELGPRGVRVTAAIANHADKGATKVPVSLKVGPRIVARGFVDLPPQGTAQKAFHHAFPAGDLFDVSVELDEDALPVDDRRFARVEVRREIRVLLVDGDPRTVRQEDELFYLETALRPGDRSESQLAVAVVTADELARRNLAEFDVVFLCNVKALPAARVAELEGFVRKGGGLFVALGDNVDPDAYNGGMAALLAQPLRVAHEAALEPTARPEGGAEPRSAGERLGPVDPRHPILNAFAGGAEGLRAARFRRYMLLAPEADPRGRERGRPGEAGRHTVLRYESGAPALVEGQLGRGRLLLFTSSVDREWNDFPIRPGYLPLMQQAARHLARSPLREPEPGGIAGGVYAVPLAAGDARLEIRLPDGVTRLYEPAEVLGHEVFVFRDTEEPGIYRVQAAAAGQSLRERASAAFVINVDPRESDLRHLAPQKVPTGGAAKAGAKPEAGRRRVELWHGVAALLLLVMLGETFIVRRG